MKTATYKGKTYRLEYLGPTKFGRRAKLAFMDGSKEFWVDAALVSEGGASSSPATRCTCDINPSGWCPKCDGPRRRSY